MSKTIEELRKELELKATIFKQYHIGSKGAINQTQPLKQKAMNAKDKAIEIMSMYRPIINNSMSKECAIIHVNGIIGELEKMPTSNQKYSKLVFYYSVLKELKTNE